MNKNKKILTLEDLESFYSKYKRSTYFSAKESGYQLAVQIPATFEIDEKFKDDTLLFCKSRMFHIGQNRNKSNVTEDAAKKAMKTMAYKPLLANFAEFEDENGNKFIDFTSHDMIIEDDSIKYLEHQIGCITADEPWFEEYEGKTYVCGYLAIPKDYTEAVSIIERKNGTKVSVELLINELTYDAKEKTMLLTDVIVSGLTCLGRNPETGEEVQEGMLNSRLDIKDFSENNNSLFSDLDKEEHFKLIETLERLNTTLSELNINKTQNFSNNEKEGGSESVTKLEELLTKYNKTVDELDFEIEGLSDEELEAKFSEAFDDEGENSEGTEGVDNGEGSEDPVVANEEDTVVEGDENPENDPVEPTGEFTENPVNETVEENMEVDDNTEGFESNEESTESVAENEFLNTVKYSFEINGEIKEYAVSLQDKIYAIQDLVNATYAEQDNTYYGVTVYEEYVIMCDWWTGRYYKQSYKDEDGNYSLVGDRVEVYVDFVTEEEQKELESMRSNYSSVVEELNKYKEAEDIADKMSIFDDESYSDYLETDEFKELMSEDALKKFSKEELQVKADAALGKLVKKNKVFSFSASENKDKKVNKIGINASFEKTDDNEPYGDYFKSLERY